jgi:peptidoglycan/xylan/chitin deacetylase (PgdA/CDA1 family)
VIYAPALIRAGDPLWPVPVPAGRVALPVRAHDRGDFETLFASQPDPWKYTSAYEQTKYEQTLSLLPAGRIAQALELACAEGHFTIQLADRVEQLVAADISRIALERTRERCRDRANIDFRRIDLASDPLPDQQDLIVCSEVLYYVGDRRRLEQVARNFCAALNPGGHVLLAHANAVIDEPDRPGFDWDIPYGARTIAEVFSDTPGLLLRSEIATPLYRIQLFQRVPEDMPAAAAEPPELLHFDVQPEDLPPEVAVHVLWQGGQPECHEPPPVVTKALPVLMYHRVAPGKADTMRRYRVSPEDFEEQLQYLRDAGFYSVGWAEWQAAAAARTPLPGRAIALTFDDGYQDVFDFAAPLLERYGFTATVFLVADRIGGSNVWDQAFAETIPLMGWAEIRELHARGLQFGSHTATHRALTGLSIAEVVDEGARSRAMIEDALRSPVRAIAYPYGDFDDPVAHVMGACGYLYGLSCRHGRARFGDSLLALPRIEIEGTDRLRDFVAKLAG